MSSDSGVTSSGALQMPRKSGHVYKRSGVVRSWKLLHFSLEGSVLYYFKHEGDVSPKGVIILSGCDIRVTRDKKLYSFRISHPATSKVYDLATTLPSRTEDWLAALQAAAVFVPNSTMLSRSESTASSGDSARDRSMSRSLSRASSAAKLRSNSHHAVNLDAIRPLGGEDAAAIPVPHRAQIEQVLADFVAKARADASGWKLQTEKLGVQAFVHSSSSSKIPAFKGVGVLEHAPFTVLQLILALAQRHEYDPQLLSTQRVVVFDNHTFIDHLVYKAMFPAAPREFVNLTHWRVLTDGSIAIVATSIDRNDVVPRREPSIVRGEVLVAGFLLVPSASGDSVNVTYITHADVKSGIPQAMQTKLFLKQAFVIDGLRKALASGDNGSDASPAAVAPQVTNSLDFGICVTERDDNADEAAFDQHDSTDIDVDDIDANSPPTSVGAAAHPFGHPTVPPAYRELIEKALARMDADLDDASAWTFQAEKHGIRSYTKIDGSLTAAKGTGFLPFDVRLIFDAATNSAERHRVDPQLAAAKLLQQLDPQTVIEYFEYKPVFVVAGRDFCNLAHWRVLPNGTIVIVAQSIEDLTLCPLREPKIVRGEVHLACWKIVPNDNNTGADVSYMVKTDLKGSIPGRVASKVAAEQPFVLLRISDMLQKMKQDTKDAIFARGPIKNRGGDPQTTTTSSQRSSGKSSTSTASLASSSNHHHHHEPEAEARVAKTTPSKPTKAATTTLAAGSATTTQQPHKPTAAAPTNPRDMILSLGVQSVVALLALQTLALPRVVHLGSVVFLLVWLATQLWLGPPTAMSPRRKLMIASFGPPDSGMILGTLEIDASNAQAFIAAKRKATTDHVTITHVVLHAIGAALKEAPSLNGHIVFGNYYKAPTIDISCLVAVDGGKDLGVCRLPAVDSMSLTQICHRLRRDATTLRSGNDKAQDDRNRLLQLLPTYIVRPITNVVGWLGGAVGLRVPPLGVEPYMFGVCMVTSVGMMGLDLAFAPLTPYAQTPMLVTVGAIKDKAVVVNGEIVVRPMLTITTTIDHRYIDGSEAARMAKSMKLFIEDPTKLEVNATK